MRVYVEGVGLLGPGLNGWEDSRLILAGKTPYVSTATQMKAAELLPAAERRRAGVAIKLAVAVGQEAHINANRAMQTTSTVFASSGGDNDNVHAICAILASAPHEVSPTRFHNSVHNAVAGYWCIAAQTHEPSTSLCAHDYSFAAGLLEASAQVAVDHAYVSLMAYDHPYPQPLDKVRHIDGSFGVAMILVPQITEKTIAALDVDYVAGLAKPSTLEDARLEALRCANPSARSLTLLSLLASGNSGQIVYDYMDDAHMTVTVTPC